MKKVQKEQIFENVLLTLFCHTPMQENIVPKSIAIVGDLFDMF